MLWPLIAARSRHRRRRRLFIPRQRAAGPFGTGTALVRTALLYSLPAGRDLARVRRGAGGGPPARSPGHCVRSGGAPACCRWVGGGEGGGGRGGDNIKDWAQWRQWWQRRQRRQCRAGPDTRSQRPRRRQPALSLQRAGGKAPRAGSDRPSANVATGAVDAVTQVAAAAFMEGRSSAIFGIPRQAARTPQ